MTAPPSSTVRLFLCGDVMTGRGIDQILPHPNHPMLYERAVRDARDYITLAERRHGPIPRTVPGSYIWGFALEEFARRALDAKIINLETAVTVSDTAWPGKGIHYRMHPRNVDCLRAAGIDCCTLANNHALDWGYDGLQETLHTLEDAAIHVAGAGRTLRDAQMPARLPIAGGGEVLVFAAGAPSSGVFPEQAAADHRPGLHVVEESDPRTVATFQRLIQEHRRPGSVVVVALHWGENWGYEVPAAQRALAHALIDTAGADLVFGHSSHHVKGFEIYGDKLIVYGAGDLINDYEGISGFEHFHGDLGAMYFVTLDAGTGRLVRLELVPTQMRRFQLIRPAADEVAWLLNVLNRESRPIGAAALEAQPDCGLLTLRNERER